VVDKAADPSTMEVVSGDEDAGKKTSSKGETSPG
jgi:hypothetical protein